MRILIAFLCMGMIFTVAVVLVAVQALIRLLPLIIAALVVMGAARWWQHRRGAGEGVVPTPARPPAIPPPMPAAHAIPARPAGWVMVPVWLDPDGHPQRHPVIDAEVISEDDAHHG